MLALQAGLMRSSFRFRARIAGYRHAVQVRIPSSDVPTYDQIFIRGDYDFGVRQEPATIVDAGANIGLASVYFANKFPKAKIVSLEPESGNFALLKANTAPYPNVVPVHAALWHRNEELDLVDPCNMRGDFWSFVTQPKTGAPARPGQVRNSVRAMTVDGLMQEFGLDRIDILKIDIEGAEKEVFSNTSAWIGKVNAIIVELHERIKPGCNRSFYCGSAGFDDEWLQGENVYLVKQGALQALTSARSVRRAVPQAS